MSRQRKSKTILEFYRRAAAARRFAFASCDPAEKADLLEVARGWQRLSHSHAFKDEMDSTGVVKVSPPPHELVGARPSRLPRPRVRVLELQPGLARSPAFSHAARDLAFASSSVAPVPFVTPRVAGQMEVIDQVHSMSGGSKREPDSRMRPTTLPSAKTS
jgi:hypothetical protein